MLARICGPVTMRYRDTDQVKLIISMDTDTNVYNMTVSRQADEASILI